MIKLLSTLFGCNKNTEPTTVNNDNQHNVVYEKGSKKIAPYMQLHEKSPNVTDKIKKKISQGIIELDAVTNYNPNNWSAFWIKGKGYQVLGNHEKANKEFKASFEIQKENPDVAREYAQSCLELGQGEKAVKANLHAIGLTPEDAGLHANLALAYLISGKNDQAKEAIEKSLKMSPEDVISQAVKKCVDDVISGKRPQPKKMKDLH